MRLFQLVQFCIHFFLLVVFQLYQMWCYKYKKKTNPFLHPFGTIVTSIFNRIFHVEDSRNRKLLICHWFCVMILQNLIHFIDEIYWNEYGKLYHLQKCTALMKRRRNSAHAILTIKPKWNEKKNHLLSTILILTSVGVQSCQFWVWLFILQIRLIHF